MMGRNTGWVGQHSGEDLLGIDMGTGNSSSLNSNRSFGDDNNANFTRQMQGFPMSTPMHGSFNSGKYGQGQQQGPGQGQGQQQGQGQGQV
mmetsp:Transcript_36630/g.81364  ORF Transcript_36630/g.81364 Transcript_36630/m.81364 type:complete len:90 (+) Transcript_36630:3-272(+)